MTLRSSCFGSSVDHGNGVTLDFATSSETICHPSTSPFSCRTRNWAAASNELWRDRGVTCAELGCPQVGRGARGRVGGVRSPPPRSSFERAHGFGRDELGDELLEWLLQRGETARSEDARDSFFAMATVRSDDGFQPSSLAVNCTMRARRTGAPTTQHVPPTTPSFPPIDQLARVAENHDLRPIGPPMTPDEASAIITKNPRSAQPA